MSLRTLLLLLGILVLAVFSLLNWSAIMAPTSLSLGVMQIQAPIGFVMLVVLLVVSGGFLSSLIYLRSIWLLESRRQAKELLAQRQLAEQAESSRLTELRALLETELRQLNERQDASHTRLLERMETLERGLRDALEETQSSLAAYIGELDDHLENGSRSHRPD